MAQPLKLYSKQHDSYCVWDGSMYKNDGKVSSADFWGLEKAANNGFFPVTTNIIKIVKDELRMFSDNENIFSDALDTHFEAVGQLYVRDLTIPKKYKYKPVKSSNKMDNIQEDSYFHEIFKNTSDEEIKLIAEYLFRYLQFIKDDFED